MGLKQNINSEKDAEDVTEVAVSSLGRLQLEIKDYGSTVDLRCAMEKECNKRWDGRS